MSSPAPARYDRRTVLLHWTTAALILFMWCGAHAIDWFPKGPPRIDARSVHIVVGVLLAGLLAYRIGWRLTGGVAIADAPSLLVRLARSVHYLLYALVCATLALGIANAWVRGDNLFNLAHIPAYGSFTAVARHALASQITAFHALAANALLVLAGGHGGMALYHRFVLGDDVLRRMGV